MTTHGYMWGGYVLRDQFMLFARSAESVDRTKLFLFAIRVSGAIGGSRSLRVGKIDRGREIAQ